MTKTTPSQLSFILIAILLLNLGCASAELSPEPNETATVGHVQMQIIELKKRPVIGKTKKGKKIRLGGFSGLQYLGTDLRTGHWRFLTHTDRGPNPEAIEKGQKTLRPFAIPNFQPEWIELSVDPKRLTVEYKRRTPLFRHDKKPISGLPNFLSTKAADPDEESPLDLNLKPLALDPKGLDLEGIARADDDTYWMADEYRPSLVHFDARGRMINRFVPKSFDASFGQPVLPSYYAQRKLNRGFEGIAVEGVNVYAFLQSPLPKSSKFSKRMIPILAFASDWKQPAAEYVYPLSNLDSDKIGDAVSIGNKNFLVIEQNSDIGPKSQHKIYKVDVSRATDTLRLDSVTKSHQVAKKTLVVDLVAIGLHAYEKLEGLAIVDRHTLAIVSDNDFSLKTSNADAPPAFVILKFQNPLW